MRNNKKHINNNYQKDNNYLLKKNTTQQATNFNEYGISVVMPVYNGEKYLSSAIESILNQTYTDFEFIIVCEYETSAESLKIVQEYKEKDSRIKIVINHERLGISASLNRGIQIAKGEYIARMDGDDISDSRRLEIQKIYMDNCPEIGILGIRHKVIGDDNWIVDYKSNPLDLQCELLFMSPLRHPSIMLRRNVIFDNNLFYDENLPGVEDYELYFRASEHTQLSNIFDDSLFLHRRTGENLSYVLRDRDDEIQKVIIKKYYKKWLDLNFSDEELNRIISVSFLNGCTEKQIVTELKQLEKLLIMVEEKNNNMHRFPEDNLKNALNHRWMRARYKMKSVCKGNISDYYLNEWRKGRFYTKWMN